MGRQRKRIKAGPIAVLAFRLALVALSFAPNAWAGADPGACSAYARGAVAQNEENLRRGCGYGGPRWQSNYDNHYGWCIREGWMFDGTATENNARSEGLAKCQAKAAPAGAPEPSGAPAKPSPPAPMPPPPVVEKRDSGARFSSMTGKVEVRREGEKEWDFANLDTVLYVGDHIRTSEESSTIIGFADLSTFLLKEESEIIITTPPEKDSMIKLVAGNIMANLKMMWKNGSMVIEMSQAVSGTKGTVFTAGAESSSMNTVATLEGAVEVRAKATGQKSLLKQGERITITAKGLGPVDGFDLRSELSRWGKDFAGKEFDEIERRVAAPAAAADGAPHAFWAVNEGADGVKIGTIFPDYSPTEFTGAVMYCIPRSGVRISVDSPKKLISGASAKVAVDIDGASTVYKGTAQDKPTEDGSVVVFNTSFNDPLLEELSAAKSVTFSVNKSKLPLPMKNLQKSFKSFFDKCGK